MTRFARTADGLHDDWTGEELYSTPREKPPFTIDRRHLAPITNEEARMLADLFGATVIYQEKIRDRL